MVRDRSAFTNTRRKDKHHRQGLCSLLSFNNISLTLHIIHICYGDFQVGCTPLHRAASTGKTEVCEFLIEEGAEIDAVDKMGQTPLMHSVICDDRQVIFQISHMTLKHIFL